MAYRQKFTEYFSLPESNPLIMSVKPPWAIIQVNNGSVTSRPWLLPSVNNHKWRGSQASDISHLAKHLDWWLYHRKHKKRAWDLGIDDKLRPERCHDANFVITGGTAGCHYDNFFGFQWISTWILFFSPVEFKPGGRFCVKIRYFNI